MSLRPPEVLAPAGDMERFLAALRYGADAIYLGGKLHNMRASTRSFTTEELAQAVSLAHRQGVKVYFTCNTLPVNGEIPALESYLAEVAGTGVDAFIVADIGVMMAARRAAPQTAIHISTQAGVTNYLTATELYKLGASRVVLARELSLEDIRCIRENTPPQLELECFVHGAMCMSFSGRCLLSDYFVGRSANRGECAQPCRWSYYLMEEKRPGQYFPVFEDEKGSYILNAKDLCLIESLDQLCRAGVSSLKIEGRAKSAYYVAVVTNAYRNAVDLYLKDPENYQLPQWLLEETRKVSHRDYSDGFLYGRPEQAQCYESGGYIRQWDVAAVVERWEAGRLYCVQRNRFYEGDRLEALIPRGMPVELEARDLRNEAGEKIPCANRAAAPFSMACGQPLPEGTILRAPKGEQPQGK
ncbi:peptidase U32 family protein [Angelakisella massiliensis]|uniref:peptidase U32 family protein n=1 Tax=Angelakisella massiliensis TaxID=1871018 RepID=UPI0008F96933|nr:U32 family peptidase [Angelakisella massiliensis]